ncbi:MAG: hypothetical protein C6H99_07625 [Epsilonproteobacteria bacterium]|nr:hypothetical protein [Campylobacterota bacterium]NPA64353.1 lysophospholipid acyltransferase family protein [Campylobacterota bacterium]
MLRKRVLLWLLPPLGALLIRGLFLTCKKRYHLRSLPDEPLIIAFWHGNLLMQPFLYKRVRPKRKVWVMISEHFDGELIARIISYFGFGAVRGSPKKGGAKALIGALRKLKEGDDVAITPDGPRGPIYSVAPGIVALAQKSGAYIVPFAYRCDRCWRLGSWDRFMIPKPFSTIDFYVGEPLKIDGMEQEEAKAFIKDQMLQYT